MKIRTATILDHTAILTLLIKWFDESQVIKGYDKAACGWLSDMICLPSNTVLVAEYNEMIIGCLGLRTTSMPWNSCKTFMCCDFIMTEKQYRTLGVANELMKEVKRITDTTGLTLLIGNSSGLDIDLKDKYFTMQGFTMLGSNFSYNGAK